MANIEFSTSFLNIQIIGAKYRGVQNSKKNADGGASAETGKENGCFFVKQFCGIYADSMQGEVASQQWRRSDLGREDAGE